MNSFDVNGIEEMRYVTRSMYSDTVSSDLSCEVVLPDYLPEIRRVLYIGGTVLPAAKYVSGSSAELNGVLEYSVLYVGSDGELYSAPASCEYDITVPLENSSDFDLNEGVQVFSTHQLDGINARVIGPRKMTVRARMKTNVRVFGRMPYMERETGEADVASICRLTEKARYAEMCGNASETITVSAELDADTQTRVSCADAHVLVEETGVTDTGISAKGSVYLKLLCTRPDGVAETVIKKLPFDCEIELETPCTDAKMCRVSGCVSEISVNVGEEKIVCDVSIILEGRAGTNRALRYTADAYSTEKQSSCEYINRDIPIMLRGVNGNFTQSERVMLSESGIPEGASVTDTYGNVIFESCRVAEDGKTVVEGTCKYVVICQKDGEYSACEISSPMRYEIETGGTPSVCDCRGEAMNCRARISGENVEVESEISFEGMFMGEERVKMLKSIDFGEPVCQRDGDIILCYPSGDDTVWSVAKRYSVSAENVKGDPSSDTYLIIKS